MKRVAVATFWASLAVAVVVIACAIYLNSRPYRPQPQPPQTLESLRRIDRERRISHASEAAGTKLDRTAEAGPITEPLSQTVTGVPSAGSIHP